MALENHTCLCWRSADPSWYRKTHHIPSITEASVPAPTFNGNIQRFNSVTDRDYVVNVAGDFQPKMLEPAFMGLETLLKKRAPASEVAGACRRTVLEASDHTKTIGRNLIGVELSNSGRSTCTFYTEDEAAVILVPPAIGPDGSWTDAKITQTSEESAKLEGKIVRRAG